MAHLIITVDAIRVRGVKPLFVWREEVEVAEKPTLPGTLSSSRDWTKGAALGRDAHGAAHTKIYDRSVIIRACRIHLQRTPHIEEDGHDDRLTA